MSARPFLRVLPSPDERVPDVRFCGYCGHRPTPEEDERICGSCDLGMILLASGDLAPTAGQPSLVIDHTLSVCAISHAAEVLLGVAEPDVVNRSLGEVLVPAQAEGVGLEGLISAVLAAAGPDQAAQRAVVRPTGEWGVRYAVRIGSCGPPSAVLLVLDDDEV